MKRNLFVLALTGMLSFSSVFADESLASRRVAAHLFIKDYQTAFLEAKKAYEANPGSRSAIEDLIVASFYTGQESYGLTLFENYRKRFGIDPEHTDFLEEVAFGVIRMGMNSCTPALRLFSALAAFHANDARGVAILQKGLKDQSALVRSASIKLAARLRDKTLQQEMLNIIAKERLYDLKLDAIRAAGSMKIIEAKELLINIITSDREGDEAKAAAIEAYVNMDRSLRSEDLRRMAKSQRVGFRTLSAVAIEHLDLVDEMDILVDHLSDTHRDVRRYALIALGRMMGKVEFPKEAVRKKLVPLLNEKDVSTRIAALWLMTLIDPPAAEKQFLQCLESPLVEVRVKTASAISSTGVPGMDLMKKAFQRSRCPYVRLNLAVGMVQLGIEDSETLATIKEALSGDERLAVVSDVLGDAIAPSKLSFSGDVLITPEAVNQMVRLELINLLAVKGDPDTQQMLRTFLTERRWGITGVASALLMTEGDDEAKDSVKKLLDDSDKKVRVQAAVVLASWRDRGRALEILEEAYEGVDRDLKIKVLESIGHIGNKKQLPFLAEKLSEPYPTLRLAASLAIIQTIYH